MTEIPKFEDNVTVRELSPRELSHMFHMMFQEVNTLKESVLEMKKESEEALDLLLTARRGMKIIIGAAWTFGKLVTWTAVLTGGLTAIWSFLGLFRGFKFTDFFPGK